VKVLSDPRDSATLLVSACLIGDPCRFDGGSKPKDLLLRLAAAGRVLPVCPERLGGLPTPRRPSEIAEGGGREVLAGRARVLDDRGRDVTAEFLRGARLSLERARRSGCRRAVLKERSPSCGVAFLRREGRLLPGCGVAAALLSEAGLDLVSDEHPRLREWIDAQ